MKLTLPALVTTSLTAGLLLAGASAASAASAGAIHEDQSETYDETRPFAAGEGMCVPWAGSFHEVRSGVYRLVTPPSDGEGRGMHVNGVIHGMVELVPDDPALPTYAGTYREKVNAVVLGTSPEGADLLRVGQYRLRLPLTGTDGSHLFVTLSGKVTVNANGVTTVERGTFTCA